MTKMTPHSLDIDMATGSQKLGLNPRAPAFFPRATGPHHGFLDDSRGDTRLHPTAQSSGSSVFSGGYAETALTQSAADFTSAASNSSNVLSASFQLLSLLDLPERENTRLPEYTFMKFADLPDELLLKILSFALYQITTPVTLRVQRFFGYRVTALALVNRKFQGMAYELHYGRNGLKLQSSIMPKRYTGGGEWTGPLRILSPGATIGSYVRKVILTLTVPAKANSVGSVQDLLDVDGDLQLLFAETVPWPYNKHSWNYENDGWTGRIHWQKHFDQLRLLRLDFKASGCFSDGFKTALENMERRGMCYLRQSSCRYAWNTKKTRTVRLIVRATWRRYWRRWEWCRQRKWWISRPLALLGLVTDDFHFVQIIKQCL